jgi:hypothetical protein
MRAHWIAILLMCSPACSAERESSQLAATAGSDTCDRACLVGVLDQYLTALTHGDTAHLPLADDERATENTAEVAFGAGLWKTHEALGSYRQEFGDATTGQVGVLAVITSDDAPAFLTLRLKIEQRKIAEVETLVTREGDSAFFMPQNLSTTDPVFDEVLPESQRRTREALIATVDKYFDGIVANDGSALMFDPECHRLENGVETAKSPNIGAQFANFTYIKHIDRRFFVADVERGLAWGIFAFQIPGDDTRAPRTTFIGELFKMVGEPIRSIQAFMLNTPFGTASGWP